jgi:hypothetical protein
MEWSDEKELCEGMRWQTEQQDHGPCRNKSAPPASTALGDPRSDSDDADGDDRGHEVKQLWMHSADKDGN